MPKMFWMALVVWSAAAQTQIDLGTQARNLPMKSGASLPGTCTIGQIFFLTSAPAGANLYGCSAANSWAALGGQAGVSMSLQGTLAGMPGTCSVGQTYFATDAPGGSNLYGCTAVNTWRLENGSETVASNGVTVGSRPTTDFLTGAGLISVITDTGTEIRIQSALDTAVVATLPGEQTGSSLLCASSSGSPTAYGCAMTPTATAYTVGMVLHWIPDVNGTGGPTTLNVDTLGAARVKQADGISDPSTADIVAGSMREVWYDGAIFRFLVAGQGPVQSVFGRTGVVMAASGDYTAQDVANAAATNSSNTFTTGTQDFSGAAHTRPAIVVSASANLPTTCGVGEMAFVSSAAAGQQIFECSAANTWTQQSGGGTAPAPVFDLFANRPSCTITERGTFFWASDVSNKKWVCDGVLWQPVAFDMQVAEPTALPWTGASSGSDNPTISNVAGTVQLSGANTVAWYEGQGMTTPLTLSPPYTIEVAFTYTLLTAANAATSLSCSFGVAGGATASSSWEQMNWAFGNSTLQGSSSITACGSQLNNFCISGDRTPAFAGMAAQPVIRARIVDDGTHRTFYYNTGSGFRVLYQELNTTGVANAGYWGLSCETFAANDQFQMTLYHASVHH
jgi:hypothetical protein